MTDPTLFFVTVFIIMLGCILLAGWALSKK
jgi:membrane-anchored protein YejM (alkaline phosphatase superfamily)